MKVLELTATQRINIVALINQSQGGPAELRKMWRVLDRVELSEDEQKEVGLRFDGPTMLWDGQKAAKVSQVELEDADFNTLRGLVSNWQGFRAGDRSWLKPLLEQLD